MICDRCQGSGKVMGDQMQRVRSHIIPCPVCGGCGIRHCCDGDQPSARDLEEGETDD